MLCRPGLSLAIALEVCGIILMIPGVVWWSHALLGLNVPGILGDHATVMTLVLAAGMVLLIARVFIGNPMQSRTIARERRWLPLIFWVLACYGAAGTVLLLLQAKPEGTVALGFLSFSLICVILAFGGNALIARIRSIGPGGVEFETWQDIERILSVSTPPLPQVWAEWSTPEERADLQGPFKRIPLSQPQLWFYEQATIIVLHLRHRGVDPETLSKGNLQRYRDLILWVGAAAINDGRSTKALEILKLLEPLGDKTTKERLFLAHAYVFGAEVEDDRCNRRSDQEKALELYKELHGSDSTNAEIFWRLGWLYDELERYDESIVANRQAAKDDRIAPWAYWNLAVSYLKLSRLKQGVERQRALDSAIDALGAIPAGPMWDFIYNDAELEGLRVDPRFSALWRRRGWKVRARANA